MSKTELIAQFAEACDEALKLLEREYTGEGLDGSRVA